MAHRKSKKSATVPPEKPWKEFEQLVARIERTLDGTGAVITHNDFVPEVVSGELRQVDASIRVKVGSSVILITVERRRRSGVEDAMWIDSLIGKMGLIGASRTIAVSRKGFSKKAIHNARLGRIDLRVISEISAEDILSWCQLDGLIYVQTHYGHAEVALFSGGKAVERKRIDPELLRAVKKEGRKAPLLRKGADCINCNDIINSWQKEFAGTEKELGHGIFPGDPPARKLIEFPIESNTYFLRTKEGMVPVESIRLAIDIGRSMVAIPATRRFRYSDAENSIVEGIEFDTKTPVGIVTLYRIGTAGMKLSIDPANQGQAAEEACRKKAGSVAKGKSA